MKFPSTEASHQDFNFKQTPRSRSPISEKTRRVDGADAENNGVRRGSERVARNFCSLRRNGISSAYIMKKCGRMHAIREPFKLRRLQKIFLKGCGWDGGGGGAFKNRYLT